MNNRLEIAHEFADAINSDKIIKIIVFGSVARGDDHDDSDIDILILSNQRDNPFMCYISLDNNYHLLTENVLNNLITVVSYDAFNFKKFEE